MAERACDEEFIRVCPLAELRNKRIVTASGPHGPLVVVHDDERAVGSRYRRDALLCELGERTDADELFVASAFGHCSSLVLRRGPAQGAAWLQ